MIVLLVLFGSLLFFRSLGVANVKASREGVTIGGRQATPLWFRIPMQILFLALLCWTTEPWRLWR